MNAEQKQALINQGCWLCGRGFGKIIEWHHFVPKSRGGRQTVPVHRICHKTLHANFTNAELERLADDVNQLKQNADIAGFLTWVANKDPDFHAPTRKRKR